MSQLKLGQLKKDSFVYGIGIGFSKGLGVILLPVYTRLFTPAEYGLIEILTLINVFLSLFLNIGLTEAQSFYFFKYKKEGGKHKQAQLVTAILQWHLTVGLLITFLAVGISPLLNAWLFESRLDWSLFAAAFAGSLFFQITGQSAHVFQLLFRPWLYLSITFLQSLASTAIAIGLIVWLDMSFYGYFLGFSLGSLFAGVVGWWLAREYITWSTSSIKLWPSILKFGLPLIPANLFFFFMESSDRWILGFYHGGVALGVYAVGIKCSMAINLLLEPFNNACGPVAFKSLHEPEREQFFSSIVRIYTGIGAAAVVLLTAISPILVKWVTTPAYFGANYVIGLLAWKHLFCGFFLFSALGIYKKEKTKLLAILYGFVAMVNITLQYLLVPKYAGLGAALAVLISFFVWNFLAYLTSQRLWTTDYPVAILLAQVTVGLFSTFMLLFFFEKGVGIWVTSSYATISAVVLIGSAIKFKQYQQWFKALNIQYNLWRDERKD